MSPIFRRKSKNTPAEDAAASSTGEPITAAQEGSGSSDVETSTEHATNERADAEREDGWRDANRRDASVRDASARDGEADAANVGDASAHEHSASDPQARDNFAAGAESDQSSVDARVGTITPAVDSPVVPAVHEPVAVAQAKPLSREMLIAQAYDSWHGVLSEAAQNAERELAAAKFAGQIEITHAHPTGAARFYSHIATKMSSLIREPLLYERAKDELVRLHEMIRALEDEHGSAAVSLSAGRFTWTELPEIDAANTEWSESYDATSELRLDFRQFTERSQLASAPAQIDAARPEAEASNTDETRDMAVPAQATTSTGDDLAEPPLAVERSAPALFRRLKIDFLADGDAMLKLSAQASINPVLLRALRQNGISEEQLVRVRQVAQHSQGVEETLALLSSLCRVYLPGFHAEEQAIVGCFHSPAQILLTDLEAMSSYIYGSGILAAVAGDETRRQISAAPVPPGLPEDRAPEAERGIGDHDVAELDVVEAVASGRSLVIDAVPGTERASTIASILADAAASGKSLIYVPAKRSLAQAVRAEFEKLGLGDLLLDFSDVEQVPMRIRTGLRLQKPEFDAQSVLAQRAELVEARNQLSTFVGDLHRVDDEWGESVHNLLEKLASLTAGTHAPRTRVRLEPQALQALRQGNYSDALARLHAAEEIGLFEREAASSAWSNSPLTDELEGIQALERARQLSATMLPAAISQASRAAHETGLKPANSLFEWFEQIDVLEGVSQSLDTFLPTVFENSVDMLIAATASKEWREARGISMKGGERRAYLRELNDLLRPGAVPTDVHEDLKIVEKRREVWRRYATDGRWPKLPDGMIQIRATRADLESELKLLARQVGGLDWANMEFAQLEAQLQALLRDAAQMETLPQRNALLAALESDGLQGLVADLRERGVSGDAIDSELELAYTSSIFERLLVKSKLLAAMGPRDLSELLERWSALDRAQVASLGTPVLLAAINNAREVMRTNRDDAMRLDSLLATHSVAALRDVIATYPRLVQAARPIWIVPPVVAVDFVPPMPWVDLVVWDTSESTLLANVISTLLRGRQIVVVGDLRRTAIANDPAGFANPDAVQPQYAVEAFAQVLPVIELPTYRVKQDELTSRSLGAYGYAGVYTPIPASPRQRHASLTVVDGRGVPARGNDGAIEATAVEVAAVVDAVLEYALGHNPDSFAVVTVSPLHARKIREALQAARATSIVLDRFMRMNDYEPFTVVDTSQVAGMRRDHIIFSPGFGKTTHGRVLHSFGPLQEANGFLALIDAIEMPRKSMVIISSLDAGDIDLERVSTAGPRLLAQILNDARSGVVSQANSDVLEEATSPLLTDLARRLEQAGLRTALNYGLPDSVRIPLAVGHAAIPGTWALAVLWDDDDYVAQASLRRRDRYRREAFEDRGWLVHQTFSTSLFIDPAGQAEAIIAKLRSAYGDLNAAAAEQASWAVAGATGGRGDSAAWQEEGLVQGVRPAERSARPSFTPGLQLSAYSDEELEAVVQWVASDGAMRSEADLLELINSELLLPRRSAQTDAVLRNVIRRKVQQVDEQRVDEQQLEAQQSVESENGSAEHD